MTPAWRRALALAAAVALAALPWLAEHWSAPRDEMRLVRAHFGATVDDDAAREVALPHRWHERCPTCRTAWYRFDLSLAEPPRDAQALLIEGVGGNAAAYLNGRLLGAGGRFSDPAARLGARPLLLPAPVALWTAGENRLYLLVKSDRPRFGRVAPPALAAEAQLQPLARARALLAVTLPQVLATAAAMLALVMAAIAFFRRREPDYALLAAAALAWAVHGFVALVIEPPGSDRGWDATVAATLAAVAAALVVLARRTAAETAAPASGPRRIAAAAVAVAAVAGAAATAWDPSGAALDTAHMLALVGCAAAGAVWLRAGWRIADARRIVAGGALAATAVAAAAAPWGGPPVPAPALPLAVAALLGVAGWLLLLRFVETLNALELLNVDLEALVRSRTAELEAQFARVRELERAQVLATERERLMRDMHDGVGGHLVSMLAMLEGQPRRPAELAGFVREALDDMRLMVDSLEPVDDDFNAVLGMFRDRLAPRLAAAGVALHWDVELLPAVPGLTPARVLHMLRMLQEAVANAIRHGRAKSLWIAATARDDGVHLEVRDDGRGFDPDLATAGRGLKNLRRRAADVGAVLTIRSRPGAGARVGWVLPRV